MTNREILIENIKHYGYTNQHIVAMEELSELQKEISKLLRGCDNRKHLIEEVADVLIIVEQLIIMNNITKKELYKKIDKKINRQLDRIMKDRELYDR